jgi:hypothetical protein
LFRGRFKIFANNLKTDILRVAKTAFHFLRIVITHRNRDHNMFKAIQARGATFCVFTAAVERTYTKRPKELILWSFGPMCKVSWASKERFSVVLLFRSVFNGLKFLSCSEDLFKVEFFLHIFESKLFLRENRAKSLFYTVFIDKFHRITNLIALLYFKENRLLKI